MNPDKDYLLRRCEDIETNIEDILKCISYMKLHLKGE